MKTLPSKELLSEVLKKDYNHTEQYGNTIFCRNMINGELHDGWDINIYELAHKYKEWAYDKGYTLVSYKEKYGWYCDIEEKNTYGNTVSNNFAQTEHEAIFKACEWVMEQIK